MLLEGPSGATCPAVFTDLEQFGASPEAPILVTIACPLDPDACTGFRLVALDPEELGDLVAGGYLGRLPGAVEALTDAGGVSWRLSSGGVDLGTIVARTQTEAIVGWVAQAGPGEVPEDLTAERMV